MHGQTRGQSPIEDGNQMQSDEKGVQTSCAFVVPKKGSSLEAFCTFGGIVTPALCETFLKPPQNDTLKTTGTRGARCGELKCTGKPV